jgi:hypothetical protein
VSDRSNGCLLATFGVTHQIYTPRINKALPVPGERPYAGVLFGSIDLTRVFPGHTRAFGLDLGVTGPPSGAEQLQNQLHRLLDNTPRRGWEYQLPTAAIVQARYEEGLRAERRRTKSFTAIDVHWGAAAGTLLSLVSAGAEVSAGVVGALPWSPADPRLTHPPRYVVTLGYQQDAVLHNVLVEGRGAGRGGTRRPLVSQLEAGFGIRHRLFSAVYRHNIRGREYDAQLTSHPYGTITLSLNHF